MPELLAELSGSSSTNRVGSAALRHIAEAIHAVSGAIIVDGTVVAVHGLDRGNPRPSIRGCRAKDAYSLLDDGSEGLFPVRIALRCSFGNTRGWLLLGPRPDGSLHGKDDREALGEVTKPLRLALFAARERELEKAREDQRFDAQADAIAQLSRRLDGIEERTGAGVSCQARV